MPLSDDAPPVMRAAVIDGFGGPDALRHTDVPQPKRVLDEVLVRVVAASVNPIDVKTRSGRGAAAGIDTWPAVLGTDLSGVVIEAPYEHHPLQPGVEVYGMTASPRSSGSFAELVAVPATHLAPKPAVLSHAEAAAVPLAALTAWGAVVELAKAHDGQRRRIPAGAGGVGHLAVQIAAYFGAQVVTTGSERNVDWLRSLGAEQVIDYTTRRFEDCMDPVDVVVDLIGDLDDRTGSRSLQVLRPGGLLVNVPSSSWPTLREDADAAGVRATTYRVSPNGATLAVISRLITSGSIRVTVTDVLPFARIVDAHREVETGHVRGKVVVQISDY